MLSSRKPEAPADHAADRDKRKSETEDSAAAFIHELAEAGSASELGTVNAAADAVEGKEDKAVRRKAKTDEVRTGNAKTDKG